MAHGGTQTPAQFRGVLSRQMQPALLPRDKRVAYSGNHTVNVTQGLVVDMQPCRCPLREEEKWKLRQTESNVAVQRLRSNVVLVPL